MSTHLSTHDVSRRRILSLAWPLALHGLITVGVAANDVVLLGGERVEVLASAVVAGSVLTVAVMTLTALGIATQIQAARAFGAADDSAARAAAEATLRAALLVGIGPLLVVWGAAPWLCRALAGGAADPALAGDFLRITVLGLPFAVLAGVLRGYATAAGRTRVVLIAGLATAGVDVVASLGLRLAWGWVGVAVGTALGYAAGAAVLVCWNRRQSSTRRLRWRFALRAPRTAVGAVLGLGWPEMLLAAFSSASGLVVVLVLADSSPQVLSASRLLEVQVMVGWVLLYAAGQGLLTVLAETEGAQRRDLFGTAVRNAVLLFAGVALALFVLGGLVAPMVVRSVGGPEVAAVVGMLGWLAWAQVGWQGACVLGLTVCRASRDTRASLIASLTGEYAVFLPAGLLLCRWLDWGLLGVLVAHHLFWATFVTIVFLRAVRARRPL
ncbi:MATE family efflux transporter [Nocardioides limicola]|uniref:MATE family efflux transporter n=1 Tax=Nocardioides limicola TaxID=2803368 RepID=UPI00193B908C|nr:MATE family efflux transporter [Nocardioides sp. DJM-14]